MTSGPQRDDGDANVVWGHQLLWYVFHAGVGQTDCVAGVGGAPVPGAWIHGFARNRAAGGLDHFECAESSWRVAAVSLGRKC